MIWKGCVRTIKLEMTQPAGWGLTMTERSQSMEGTRSENPALSNRLKLCVMASDIEGTQPSLSMRL